MRSENPRGETAEVDDARVRSDPSRKPTVIRRWGALFVLLVLLGAGLGVGLTYLAQASRQLPVYWTVPEFRLIDQTGDTLDSGELRQSVWVASFVFTNCTSVCPLITQKMAGLRDSLAAEGLLGGKVRLVSFTVDPARDTPGVLREYAAKFGGSPPKQWAFLTGAAPDSVRQMVEEGFKLAASAPPGHEHVGGNYQVMHSPMVQLVDRNGRVRGFYDTTEPDAMERLGRDLRTLLR